MQIVLLIVFVGSVVLSAVLAVEYARIDSITVDFKVEEFEHAAGSAAPFEAVRVNSTVDKRDDD